MQRKLIWLGCAEVVTVITLSPDMLDGLRELRDAVKKLPCGDRLYAVQWWADGSVVWKRCDDVADVESTSDDNVGWRLGAVDADIDSLDDARVEMEMVEIGAGPCNHVEAFLLWQARALGRSPAAHAEAFIHDTEAVFVDETWQIVQLGNRWRVRVSRAPGAVFCRTFEAISS